LALGLLQVGMNDLTQRHQIIAVHLADKRIGIGRFDPVESRHTALGGDADRGILGVSRAPDIKGQPVLVRILLHKLRRWGAIIGDQPAADQRVAGAFQAWRVQCPADPAR